MATGPYAKLIIGGDIDTVQGWSIGFSCQAQTAPSSAELSAWLATVEPLVTTWWNGTNGPKTQNKPTCRITVLDAYGYSQIGTPSTGVAQRVLGSPLVGGSAAVVPSQCAMVLSLLTGFPGRHNRGRVYLPATGALIGSNNRLPAAQATGMATITANLVKALATTTINGTTTAAVLVPASGSGASHFVSQVSVGDVIDTQRRRRDKYVENRYAVSSSS